MLRPGIVSSVMACRLVLQLPTSDLRRARVVAATDDPAAIREFVHRLLENADLGINKAPDPYSRELALIERDQLQARLDYALRLMGPTHGERA